MRSEKTMKRDMDLVRKILLEVESRPNSGRHNAVQIEGYDKEIIVYHINLLAEAGLLHLYGSEELYIPGAVTHLTWEGHEFLDASRTPMIWDEVKAEVAEKGLLSASWGIIKSMLDKAARKRIGDL